MDVVVIDSSAPPASPSHHQPQLSQDQRLSIGRGISRSDLWLLLNLIQIDFLQHHF
jgi:hypothetical protein